MGYSPYMDSTKFTKSIYGLHKVHTWTNGQTHTWVSVHTWAFHGPYMGYSPHMDFTKSQNPYMGFTRSIHGQIAKLTHGFQSIHGLSKATTWATVHTRPDDGER